MSDQEERAYGWDDQIEKDGADYTLLAPGDYPFVVTKFERGRYEGGDKIGPCNKAIVTIEVNGETLVQSNMLLHSKVEGILCSFFKCIGHRKHGEPLRMNWPATIGCKGWVKIKHREYDGKKYNDVAAWIDPEKAPKNGAQPAATAAAQPLIPWNEQF